MQNIRGGEIIFSFSSEMFQGLGDWDFFHIISSYFNPSRQLHVQS